MRINLGRSFLVALRCSFFIVSSRLFIQVFNTRARRNDRVTGLRSRVCMYVHTYTCKPQDGDKQYRITITFSFPSFRAEEVEEALRDATRRDAMDAKRVHVFQRNTVESVMESTHTSLFALTNYIETMNGRKREMTVARARSAAAAN